MKCNIKDNIDALNHGLDSFEKAFKYTGGKMTDALKFALSEIKNQYPELDIDSKTFTDHVSDIMKEADLIPKSYEFGKGRGKNKDDKTTKISSDLKGIEKDEKVAESKKNKYREKVAKTVDKLTGLKEDQKATVVSELMNELIESGIINNKLVLNAISKATGKPEMTQKILDASDALSDANFRLESAKDNITETVKKSVALNKAKSTISEEDFNTRDEKIKKELEDLAKEEFLASDEVKKAGLELSRLTPPYSFWYHDNIMAAQLNLMTAKSFWKNITGTLPDAAIRYMGSSVGAVIGLGFPMFKKTNPLPFGSKALGVIYAAKNKKIQRQMKLAAKYGSNEVAGDIPSHNYFDYINKFRNAKENWKQGEKKQAIIDWLGGALRVSPGIAGKILATPDQAIYTSAYEAELNSLADSKNLTGSKKTAFMMRPDERSALYAHDKARFATYKNDIKLIKKFTDLLSYDPRKHYQELIANGTDPITAKARTSVIATFKMIAAPFVKTPAALVNFTFKYIIPEADLAKTMWYDFRPEEDANIKNRIMAESVGRYVAAATFRYIAINMVAQGLISSGFSDDDERLIDVQEQAKGGPSKINVSALFRGMTGQGYKERKGDQWHSLSFLGGTGMIMGTYARMYSKMSEEERIALSDQNPTDPSFYLSSPSAPIAVIRSAMENSFLSGTNMIFKTLSEENEDQWSKFGINAANLMMTGAYNSHLQELSKASDPNVKKQYDKDLPFHENLLNKFGYNFAYGKLGTGMKDKFFSLSKEEELATKKKRYLLFDNYLGRFLANETGLDADVFFSDKDSEASKLYTASQKVEKEDRKSFAPAGVGQVQSVKFKSKGKTSTINVDLTPEQHEFLMKKASMARMFFAAPVINSDEFSKSHPMAQSESLQKAYKLGLDEAKKMLLARYPEVKKQKTDKQIEEDEMDDSIKEQVKKLEKYIPKKIINN